MEKQMQNTVSKASLEVLPPLKNDPRKSIYLKIQTARKMLRGKNLRKSGWNSYKNYFYYELEDILPAVDDISEELKLYTELNLENDRAVLTVINLENPAEQRNFVTPLIPPESDKCKSMQDLGGFETYAHRYALIRAFHITEPCVIDANVGNIDVEKTIGTIKNISDLNSTYRVLKSLPPETKDKWGPLLKKKSKAVGASFDKNNMVFVCPQKSNAVAAMI
jgi:hypothetical protein